MKTETGRRLGWLAACLLAAVPAVRAADDIAADWREVLSKGDNDALEQTYALVNTLRDGNGGLDTALCREKAAAIDAALKINRVGLGLWLVAQECARADGNEALAEQRQQRFEALLKHALKDRLVLQGQVPIRVLAVQDAEAVALATGQEILYRGYEPYEGGRHLPLTLALWDENSRRETLLEFDFMDAAIQLQRDQPGAEFPSFRRDWVRATVAAAAEESPDSSLALLQALDDSKSDEQDKAAAGFRRIIARAQAGDMMASMLLSLICAEQPRLDCRDQAIDALLPLAEKRYSLALVSLAYLYSRDSKKTAEHKAAQALLTQADQRLGNVDGSLMFAAMGLIAKVDKKIVSLVEQNVAKAAAAGNLRAGVVLPVLRGQQTLELKGEDLPRLQAAAEAGMPVAQFNLGLYLLAQKKMEQGQKWIHRAAEAGFPQAQKWLGVAYYFGKHGLRTDNEAGLHWLKLAGQGGQGDASALVGQYYAENGTDLAAYKRAEGWLFSGVTQESKSAGLHLAELYERDIDGLGGTSANAARIYELLIADSDNPDARRGLARVLTWSAHVEKDLPRAEKLLRPDAQKGDVMSQFQLGEILLQRDRSEAQMAEGVQWLRKSAASNHYGAQAKLAESLWWGRGTPVDTTAARALWDQVMVRAANPVVSNNFAWAHCTPRDPALLDAAAGLAAIQNIAAREGAEAFQIGTLAACQAASGDFAGAVANQKRTIAKLEAQEKPDAKRISEARADLKRYEAGKRNDLGEF